MKGLFIACIFLSIAHFAFPQEIKLNSIKEAKNDISAREHEVIDANGDASALIKARISLDSLDFSSDLGINRIEEHDGEVWLWVPPGTRNLTVYSTNDTLTVMLPGYITEYSVCVVMFTVVLDPNVRYVDMPVFEINTRPRNADIFINNLYQGKSPIKVSILPDTIFYRIEKNKYDTLRGNLVLNENGDSINLSLTRSKMAGRWLIQSLYSGVINSDIATSKNIGFTLGYFGKFGFYASMRFPLNYYKGEKIDSRYELFEKLGYPADKYSEFYHKRFIYSFGFSARITEFMFISGGITFDETTAWIYDPDSSYQYGYKSKGKGIEFNIHFRIKTRYVISMGAMSLTDGVGYRENDDATEKFSYFSLGLGYTF